MPLFGSAGRRVRAYFKTSYGSPTKRFSLLLPGLGGVRSPPATWAPHLLWGFRQGVTTVRFPPKAQRKYIGLQNFGVSLSLSSFLPLGVWSGAPLPFWLACGGRCFPDPVHYGTSQPHRRAFSGKVLSSCGHRFPTRLARRICIFSLICVGLDFTLAEGLLKDMRQEATRDKLSNTRVLSRSGGDKHASKRSLPALSHETMDTSM